ncbi:MAG: repressor LexA [Lentisphaerales bacterium]|jgi:repressor LexA|nr:MAG: repressor LexA [Lentisphaerales bacterium]
MPRKTDLAGKLQALRSFYRKEGRMPGYSEMLSLFEYQSKNAVHGLLEKFRALGYVRKTEGGKIAPTGQLTGTIRLLGSVQAGFPSPAEEELVDVLSLDDFLVSRPDATFMLKVSGDSMIDAGIHPGDIVLVEKGRSPKSGDIVIAQVDGEWTMKYFTRRGKTVRLEPANRKYKPIDASESLTIGGIVSCVIRKYK